MSQKKSEWKAKLQEKIKENKFVTPSSHLDAEEIKSFIQETLSNREKEIAEEVEGSVYAAFFSEAGEDDFEEYNNWRKNVLPGIILKHQ